MARGGARPGAGRPKGLGKFGEKTKPLRVPETMVDQILGFITNKENTFSLPIYSSDHFSDITILSNTSHSKKLDLNKHLIKQPSSTFFFKVTTPEATCTGVNPGDILIINKSKELTENDIVVALSNQELIARKLKKNQGKTYLVGSDGSLLELEPNIQICGAATAIIKKL